MSAAAVRRLAVLLAIAAVLAFFFWRSTRPEAVPVVLGTVDRGRVERSVANTRAGTVNACRRAKLAPPAGGQIAALRVHEGDRVREGDVLLELWNEDAAAQARVAEEQARSAVLRVDEVCVRADTAERDAARARSLNRDGLLPDDQLDRAISSAKTLRAACDAARVEVKQSQARIELARATLTRTVLRAPFGGVVAKVTGEVGEFTTPSPPGIPTPPAIDLIDAAIDPLVQERPWHRDPEREHVEGRERPASLLGERAPRRADHLQDHSCRTAAPERSVR